MSLISLLGYTARLGPLPDELSGFPVWKRVAVRLTPRKNRWKWSVYAPILRDML